MPKFDAPIDLPVISTVGGLPAATKGRLIYSEAHNGLIMGDGVVFESFTNGANYPFPQLANDYIDGLDNPFIPTAFAQAAATAKAYPIAVERDTVINQLNIEVTVALAGANVIMALYDSDGNNGFLPGTKLFDSGTLSAAAIGAVPATIGTPITLRAGRLYWLSTLFSAASTIRSIPASSPALLTFGIAGALTLNWFTGLAAAQAFATGLPASGTTLFTAATRAANTNVWVKMRIN